MEADPGTFDAGKLRAYMALGVNRFSIGVQAFQQVRTRRLDELSQNQCLNAHCWGPACMLWPALRGHTYRQSLQHLCTSLRDTLPFGKELEACGSLRIWADAHMALAMVHRVSTHFLGHVSDSLGPVHCQVHCRHARRVCRSC